VLGVLSAAFPGGTCALGADINYVVARNGRIRTITTITVSPHSIESRRCAFDRRQKGGWLAISSHPRACLYEVGSRGRFAAKQVRHAQPLSLSRDARQHRTRNDLDFLPHKGVDSVAICAVAEDSAL